MKESLKNIMKPQWKFMFDLYYKYGQWVEGASFEDSIEEYQSLYKLGFFFAVRILFKKYYLPYY